MEYKVEKLHLSGVAPKVMSLQSLEEMTNNFSQEQKLGSGTFGKVYKGVQNGEEFAVKMFHVVQGLEDYQHFENEFDNLRRLRHPNIVKLYGYCYEIKHEYIELSDGRTVFAQNIYRALCFEYLDNGSIKNHLYDEYSGHDWQTRYKIIKGICEGLKYLHEGLETPIYHLDLKPDNILLGKNMVPKLADFGLSRLVGDEQTRATRSSLGTIGYLPPEYIEKHLISKKLDIFSLGVVIIDIMTGHKGYHKSAKMSSQEFIGLVHDNWRNRLKMVPRCTSLEAECHQVKRCIEIALECVHPDRKKRPKIGVLIHLLDETEQMIDKMAMCVSPETRNGPWSHVDKASRRLSSLADKVKSMDASIAPCQLQRVIPNGPVVTSTQVLDVHPLELCFPFEPNKLIECPLSFTNRTHRYVGVLITPADLDTRFYFIFPHMPFLQIMEPHSTWVRPITMKKQQKQPPQEDIGKFEVLMIILGSMHDLRSLKSSTGLKLNNKFLKMTEELGGEVHRAMLRAVIYDPKSCQATVSHKVKIISTVDFKDVSSTDVHPVATWILASHRSGYVSIWNYRTKERVMALQISKEDGMLYLVHRDATLPTALIHSAKFIYQKQWLVAGDDYGYVHAFGYTTMDTVKKLEAHNGKPVSSLAVHPTYPFLLTSSSFDRFIKLWDWEQEWVCTRTFDGQTTSMQHLMFNPRDMNTFSCVSNDSIAKVWHIHYTSNPITTLKLVDPYSVDHLFTGSHRQMLVTCGTLNERACVWDLQTNECVHSLGVHKQDMRDVACHPTLPIFVTRLNDGTLCLWDANTYRVEKMVQLTDSPIRDLVFTGSKDVTRLVAGCTEGIAIVEINLSRVKGLN